MPLVDELVEAFTNAGLTFGRPAPHGYPELRVKSATGRAYSVKILKFSFMVTQEERPDVAHQRLTAQDVLAFVRSDGGSAAV